MKVQTFLTAAALTLASALSAQAACSGHSDQAMSCAEGMIWDTDSRSCVPQTTS